MAKDKGPDWDKIRAEYVAGAKPRELSEKYGIPAKRIGDEASRRKWRALREKTSEIAREKLTEKLGEAIADAGAEWVTQTLTLAEKLRTAIGGQLDPDKKQIVVMGSAEGVVEVSVPFLNNPRDYHALVKALMDIDKVGRAALRLDEKKEGGGDKPNPGREAGDPDTLARAILQDLGEVRPAE